MPKQQSIFIIAGEASGDLHGSNLVKSIYQLRPDVQIYAMGGSQLQQAGAKLIVNSKNLSAIGFTEIFNKLRHAIRAFKNMVQAIKSYQPELIILVDYPEFNLRFAKAIKKAKIKTKIIYYISPQIWAWRPKRINIIKKYVDLMAVIFPFEVIFYQRANVPVKFVGHPLTDHVQVTMSPSEARQSFALKNNSIVVGLMPGSRQSEIKFLLSLMLEVAKKLQQRYSNIEFILPIAATLSAQDLNSHLQKTDLNIKLITQNSYDAISVCNAVIVASGTATLEVAMLGIPMTILYRMSPITYLLAKLLVNVKNIGICNLVARETIVREFIQDEATVSNIYNEVVQILENTNYRNTMIQKLKATTAEFKNENSSSDLAKLAVEMLPSP